MHHFAANPLELPEDSFGNHLSAGYSEAKISQWQFQISSSPCTNTSADMNNPQFKMDDSAQRICWLGGYSLYYFVRDGKPITTNQIALCRPFLPLLSLEYTKQSSSQGCLKHSYDNVIEDISSSRTNLRKTLQAWLLTPRNSSVLIHNDMLIYWFDNHELCKVNHQTKRTKFAYWVITVTCCFHSVWQSQAEQMSPSSPSNMPAVC